MATRRREKFTTRVNSEILAAVRSLARSEGRRFKPWWMKLWPTRSRSAGGAGRAPTSAYQASYERHAPLYKKLAE